MDNLKDTGKLREDAARINVWVCEECGKEHVCRDVDEGVTPFMLGCKEPGCNGQAYSRFYNVHPAYALRVEYEWFRPTKEQRRGESRDLKDYHDSGGLALRRVGHADSVWAKERPTFPKMHRRAASLKPKRRGLS